MVKYALGILHLARIVATTTYHNTASIGVMRRLGMRVERNPLDEPPCLQVVGVLEYDGLLRTGRDCCNQLSLGKRRIP